MRTKVLFILAPLFLFSACKKSPADKAVYTIKGQLLESSENPIPVSNYKLKLYQQANSSMLGGVSGINTTLKTGADGRFTFEYARSENYGTTSGSNINDIFISGADSLQYQKLSPEWNNITAETDINLSPLYLFKKIDLFVRRIEFNNQLNSGDSLQVISTDSTGASYKTLYGPIERGSLVTVDTIINCKISKFNYGNKEYVLIVTLQNPSFLRRFSVVMTGGDEKYREILMNY